MKDLVGKLDYYTLLWNSMIYLIFVAIYIVVVVLLLDYYSSYFTAIPSVLLKSDSIPVVVKKLITSCYLPCNKAATAAIEIHSIANSPKKVAEINLEGGAAPKKNTKLRQQMRFEKWV